MNDETRSTENDPLSKIQIDERFAASATDKATVASAKNPHLDATMATPRNRKPGMEAVPQESEKDPLIGQTIDNYEVVSQLGRGGFGTVYKAKDVKLQRFAALKFLRFPLDSDFRAQFEREAQVIANLSKHPSIVQIYSWGEFQGSQYFALEFLDTSLESQLKKRGEPLSVKQALEIVADTASALHYAHSQGVLHRDIKPANILIDGKTGRAKVCDFGLAKFSAAATGTDTQTIAGSPHYMAPEQISGKGLDARTDVHALGVTLYEMLSRELPATGSSQLEVMDKIRSRNTTPLRKYRPDLSDAILTIVKRATAFLPEDRFQSAEEMEDAARAVLRSLESTGSADSGAFKSSKKIVRFQPRMLAAAGIAVVLALGGTVALPRLLSKSSGSQNAGGSVWPTAIAEARQQIDAGKYGDAITFLEGYLKTNENEDFAKYALGYAQLLSNNLPAAEAAFGKVSDVSLREEGMAAVEHAEKGNAARTDLEAVAAKAPSSYPAVMLASIDVLENHNKEAVARLEGVNKNDLVFDWQRQRYSELAARAYYNTGDYAKAESVAKTMDGESGLSAGVSSYIMARAERDADASRREALTKQIDQIKGAAAGIKADAASTGEVDSWTSRPFRMRIEPANANNCRLAQEEGLAEVFGDLMADTLMNNEAVPVEIVDREYIGDVVYEQQLAQLSQGADKIQLGKLLGARLMLASDFRSALGEDSVKVKIVDTETGGFIPVESGAFDRRTDIRKWASEIALKAGAALQKRYPVRGILKKGANGPELNVGGNVSVKEGMKFAVMTAPGVEHRLANVTATAAGVGPTSTKISLEPADATIPDGGWYLEQIQ